MGFGLSFQAFNGSPDIRVHVGALLQCRVLRQQIDDILCVNGTSVLGCIPGKIPEAVVCCLLIQLSLQLLDLLKGRCQIGRFLRTECGKTLLRGGQLLLERVLPCVGCAAVATCQCHDRVHLGVRQALDCSQIFSFHGSSLWATALLRPAGDSPTRPISLGVSDLESIVPWFLTKNVTRFLSTASTGFPLNVILYI